MIDLETAKDIYFLIVSSPFALGGIMAVSFIMFDKIQDIKRSYNSDFDQFVEEELREIRISSVARFLGFWKCQNDVEGECIDCIHPHGSFIGTIKLSLRSTKEKIVHLRFQNHFHKLNSVDLEAFARVAARRIRGASQDYMVANSVGLGKLIYATQEERYAEEEAVKVMIKILTYSQQLRRDETKEILSLVTGYKLLLICFKGVVK